MPERQLRQRIRQALRLAFPGALVLGWPSNQWTGAGWPDLLFSEWPLLVGFEVKQGRRSKPTPLQLSRHVELRTHHIPVAVTYSPEHAVDIIKTLKERLPMAFDPSLLAELEAALNEAPPENTPDVPFPDPNPAIPEETWANDLQAQATADQNAADLANGTATVIETLEAPEFIVLDADAPAPDIEDLIAATQANTEIMAAETDALSNVAQTYVEALRSLQVSVDALTAAIGDLIRNIDADVAVVPQTAEAPAPRRRTRRN